jgi:hypothetical protein
MFEKRYECIQELFFKKGSEKKDSYKDFPFSASTHLFDLLL